MQSVDVGPGDLAGEVKIRCINCGKQLSFLDAVSHVEVDGDQPSCHFGGNQWRNFGFQLTNRGLPNLEVAGYGRRDRYRNALAGRFFILGVLFRASTCSGYRKHAQQ